MTVCTRIQRDELCGTLSKKCNVIGVIWFRLYTFRAGETPPGRRKAILFGNLKTNSTEKCSSPLLDISALSTNHTTRGGGVDPSWGLTGCGFTVSLIPRSRKRSARFHNRRPRAGICRASARLAECQVSYHDCLRVIYVLISVGISSVKFITSSSTRHPTTGPIRRRRTSATKLNTTRTPQGR